MGIKSAIIKELTERLDSGALDMSQAARFERAREQGFDVDTPLFHGTSADISEFLPGEKSGRLGKGIYFTDRAQKANTFAKIAKIKDKNATPSIIQAFLNNENPFVIAEHDLPIMGFDSQKIKDRGFTGIKMVDSKGDLIEETIFDPKNIRSVNAAFDPAKKTSSNLLASSPVAALGATALAASTDEGQTRIDAIMAELRSRGALGLADPLNFSVPGGVDTGTIEARRLPLQNITEPLLNAIGTAADVELPIVGKPFEGVGAFVRDIGFEGSPEGKLKKAAIAALDII